MTNNVQDGYVLKKYMVFQKKIFISLIWDIALSAFALGLILSDLVSTTTMYQDLSEGYYVGIAIDTFLAGFVILTLSNAWQTISKCNPLNTKFR